MDWWTPGIGSGQRAVGALLGTPIDQATCGPQLDVAGTIFDPWLNTDDLDLGTILSQATNAPSTTIATATTITTTTDTLGSVASLEQKTAAALASNQTTPAGQQLVSSSSNSLLQHQSQAATTITSRQTATHSRLSASDNKHHIINIINNSSASNQRQQHPVMGLVSRRDAGGSIAGSPLSSSLGSSPPNTQANYLSSPHSSLSPPQTLKQSYGDNTPNNQNSSNDDNNNDSTSCTKPYITVQLQQNHHHNQQQQLATASYFPEVYLIEGADHDTNLALEDQSNQGQPQGGANTYTMQASVAGRPQLVYQDNMIVVACSQQQQQQQRATGRGITTSVGSRTNCGSSLLSALPSSSMNLKQNAKQTGTRRLGTKGHNTNKQQQASSNGAVSNQQLQQQPQKMRRCRHITDYVLAEEEKRLLIKEGHADFPMNCQARPLTKNEERILRKIRRKIRNKKSAQCSRQRKKEYVEELERKYAAVVRENEELRQLLAGDMNVETKFIDQQDMDGSHQERLHNHHHHQEQQQNTLHNNLNHNNHHHQQQTLFDDNQQQQQQQIASQHQDENFLNSSQSSNGTLMDQMSWKDLFPGTQQQRE